MMMMDSGSISSVSILFARAVVLVPEVPVYMPCWETHFAAAAAEYNGRIIYSSIN